MRKELGFKPRLVHLCSYSHLPSLAFLNIVLKCKSIIFLAGSLLIPCFIALRELSTKFLCPQKLEQDICCFFSLYSLRHKEAVCVNVLIGSRLLWKLNWLLAFSLLLQQACPVAVLNTSCSEDPFRVPLRVGDLRKFP